MKTGNLVWLAIVALLLLGGGSIVIYNSTWKRAKNADKYLPALHAAEIKYGIPTDLLARQAYQESHFRDDIVSGATASSAGALGLMQIVPKYHPGVDPLNVSAAIDYAAKLMVANYKQFGSWALALAAYNAGAGNVKKYNGIPPFVETQNYVSQIMDDLVDPNNDLSKRYYA